MQQLELFDNQQQTQYLSADAVRNKMFALGYVIDSEFEKIFLKYKIKKYKLLTISLKDLIIDDWQNKNKGKGVRIINSPNYKYLCGDKSDYINRCKNEPTHSCQSFDDLIQKLNEGGFNASNIIIVKQRNYIIDGAHRASWLAYKYGEDYKVTVLKLFIK